MKKNAKRQWCLWPSGLLSCSLLLFAGLSMWNSHKAIQKTNPNAVAVVPWASHLPEKGDDLINLSNSTDPMPEPVCLTENCLVSVAQRIARSFPMRPHHSWCIPARQRGLNSIVTASPNDDNTGNTNSTTWQGLLLVKVPKAASSTVAGLVLRIANRTQCAVQWEHREGWNYAHRSPVSLLLGSVRRPSSRNLSAVWFFLLTPMNITPTDANIIRSLHTHRGGKTKGKGGFQSVYLSLETVTPRSVWTPHAPTQVIQPEEVHARIQRLLHGYDFMLLVERMDESLTALALLTGLSLPDVLVTSAKVTGGWLLVRVGRQAGQCVHQAREPLSPGVEAYISSDEWLAMNYADEILFRAVNASLDRTIAQLGPALFARRLAEFRNLKDAVQQYCGERLGLGCTKEGDPLVPKEACYDRDFGCGYTCIDDFVDNQH